MTAGIRSLATVIAAAAATTNGEAAPAADAPGAAAGAAGAAGSATGGYVGSTQQQATLQELLEPQDHKRMFVSIAGTTMVTYSVAVAKLLHNMPLALVLTAPHTLQLLSPSTVRFGVCVLFVHIFKAVCLCILVVHAYMTTASCAGWMCAHVACSSPLQGGHGRNCSGTSSDITCFCINGIYAPCCCCCHPEHPHLKLLLLLLLLLMLRRCV
jgi:hypothetical protein